MSDRYEQDFIGWTEAQARLLRLAAAERPNLGLDWDHLAEEIEDLGRSQRHALESQIRRIVLHLLKLDFSPAVAPRPGWIESIADARAEIAARLRSDPGLRPRLPGLIADETPTAIRQAVSALHAYGEDTSAVVARQRSGISYTQDQILGDWLPEPRGR